MALTSVSEASVRFSEASVRFGFGVEAAFCWLAFFFSVGVAAAEDFFFALVSAPSNETGSIKADAAAKHPIKHNTLSRAVGE
ncbi:MAG TPA: hypothetical protein VFD27_09860 [Chthoniobacteraceae bacterium]|nr:hypothetical protein [Chthoniobacteraceae bacterium]